MTPSSLRDLTQTLYNVSSKLRGRVDIFSFKSYLLSLIFLRHLSLLDIARNYFNLNKELPQIFVPQEAKFDFLFLNRHLPKNAERIDDAFRKLDVANENYFRGLLSSIHFQSQFGHTFESDGILRDLIDLLYQPASKPTISEQLDESAGLYDAAVTYLAELEGKYGEDFTTPPAVCELLAGLLQVKTTESLCDPACGAASLLITVAQSAEKFSGARLQRIFGQEKNHTAWALARMNLFIHGYYQHNIEVGDTLQSPALLHEHKLMKFDVVVSHPPFGSSWDAEAAVRSFPTRFYRGIPSPTKAELAFIMHMLATLNEDHGRMAVVVSNGVLFRGGVEAHIRKSLIEENLLDAIISLPAKLFYNTTISSTIILFRKDRNSKKRKEVLFIDASHNFTKGKNFNTLGSKHIAKILDTYSAYCNVKEFSRVVEMSEIYENDFNLTVSRYVDANNDETPPLLNLADLRQERKKLQGEIKKLDDEIWTHIQRFLQ